MHLLQCYTTVDNFQFVKNVEGQYGFNRKNSTGKRLLLSPESTSLVVSSFDMTKNEENATS